MSESDNESALKKRLVRSFVKRTGRKTEGQRYALEHYWPLYGVEFEADKKLDFSTLFPGLSGVKLEIGFGNGDSLVQMAQQDSAHGYIGIEVHTPGVGHCLAKLHEAGLQNLKLISHDAIEVLELMIPENSLDAVFLFFPDPWHKQRHHKRRIVNQYFRDLLVKALKPGGRLHMATDWQNYAKHMASEFLGDERFQNLGDEQGYSPKPDYRPTTKFERRGHRLGHGVWDLLFARN
jgi:tRNA (guanine-N7-)-methyltransferase